MLHVEGPGFSACTKGAGKDLQAETLEGSCLSELDRPLQCQAISLTTTSSGILTSSNGFFRAPPALDFVGKEGTQLLSGELGGDLIILQCYK